jgi:hypothetical protein
MEVTDEGAVRAEVHLVVAGVEVITCQSLLQSQPVDIDELSILYPV